MVHGVLAKRNGRQPRIVCRQISEHVTTHGEWYRRAADNWR